MTSILGLQWGHQKFKLTTFLTKFLHKVNNTVLNDICKCQVDIPINARVTAGQSLEKSPYIYIPAAMLVGKRMPSSTIFYRT